MARNFNPDLSPDMTEARAQGRREGLALAALATAVIAYLNLLGAEKSILAGVLALMALSGPPYGAMRKRAMVALGLAGLHLVSVAVLLVLFHQQLAELLHLLHKLG